jgi:uncharacterized membrane protein YqiK
MAKLVYQPTPDDPDATTVAGLTFAAYEPTELDDGTQADLIAKLKRNPWFALDVPDQARFLKWKSVRDAQNQAASHRAAADHLDANPEAAAAHADAAYSQADSVLADARARAATAIAQAHELVARAQAEADAILANAHAEADAIKAVAGAPAPQANQTSTQAGGNA